MTLKNPILYNDLVAETGNSKEMTALATKYIRTRDVQKKVDLRDKILLGCLRFIRKVTIRTVGSNSEFIEDAFQSACISFLTGLDKFKPVKRVQFLTYVYFWIVKGINDEYHSRSIIFLSKDSYKQDRFQNMQNTNLVYFDKMVNSNDENQNTNITKAMRDNKEDISSLVDRESISKRLDFIMRRCLNGTEYALVRLRYFYDEQPTYKEVSKFIGVSPQFLSISERNAIKKLKKAMSIQKIPRLKKTRAKIGVGMDTDAIYEYILNERIRRENEKA